MKRRSLSFLHLPSAAFRPIGAIALAWLIVSAQPPFAHGQLDESTLKQRRARIEKMSENELREFDKNRKKFYSDSFSESERQKLRDLHRAIAKSEESKALLETMNDYYQWLKTVPPYDRAELENLDSPRERVAWIREYRQKQQRQSSEHDPRKRLPEPLQDENIEPLYRWLVNHAAERFEKHLQTLTSEQRRELLERFQHERRAFGRPRNQEPPPTGEMLIHFWMRRRHGPENFELIQENDLQAMRKNLSPKAQIFLEQTPPEKQFDLIRGLIFIHLMEQYFKRRQPEAVKTLPTDEELADFLQNRMDENQRDMILTLPADRMRRALIMSYLAGEKENHARDDRFGPRKFFNFGPPGRGPDSRGGPPPGRGDPSGGRGRSEKDRLHGPDAKPPHETAPFRGGRERRQ
jgi:hypothetical protein